MPFYWKIIVFSIKICKVSKFRDSTRFTINKYNIFGGKHFSYFIRLTINSPGYAFVNLKYYPDSTEVDWTRVNPTNLPQKEDTKIQIFQGENDEICINNIENKGIQVSLVDITGKLLYISSFNSHSIIKIPYQINKNCLYLVKIMDRDGHVKIVKYNKP